MSTARELLQEKIYEVTGITPSLHEDTVDGGGLLTFNLIRNRPKWPHSEGYYLTTIP